METVKEYSVITLEKLRQALIKKVPTERANDIKVRNSITFGSVEVFYGSRMVALKDSQIRYADKYDTWDVLAGGTIKRLTNKHSVEDRPFNYTSYEVQNELSSVLEEIYISGCIGTIDEVKEIRKFMCSKPELVVQYNAKLKDTIIQKLLNGGVLLNKIEDNRDTSIPRELLANNIRLEGAPRIKGKKGKRNLVAPLPESYVVPEELIRKGN